MNEAVNPTNDSGLSASNERVKFDTLASQETPLDTPTPATVGDEWQTINFPGAIAVDAIPHAGDSQTLVEQLCQENAGLRTQIARMEQDLAQGQIDLQLVLARSLQSDLKAPAEDQDRSLRQAQELTTAQERANRLFQELELSHQTAQRQQILVETLTEQLESSQERIAQLERDCSLLQQRYNEQVQQHLQIENTCRDLRMRLHRQQQQTLQFKAALEKSLEVSAAQRQTAIASPFTGEEMVAASTDTISSVSPHDSSPTPLIHRNTPVQPWSTPSNAAATAAGFAALIPKPLSNLLNLAAQPSEGEEPNSLPDLASANPVSEQPQDLNSFLNQIFPATAELPVYTIESAQQAATIFDPTPFLSPANSQQMTVSSTTEVDSASVTPQSFQIEDEELVQALAALQFHSEPLPQSQPLTPPHPEADDTLWKDLENLIDPASANSGEANSQIAAVSVNAAAQALPSASEGLRSSIPQNSLPEAGDRAKGAEPASQPVHPDLSSRKMELPPTSEVHLTQPSLKVFGLNVSGHSAQDAPRELPPGATLFTTHSPSPVVYPLRPAKKLKSMAAVDLPSFPRPQ